MVVEMLVELCLRFRLQVKEVAAEDARPYDIDLEYVDVARTRGKQLLVKREPFRC